MDSLYEEYKKFFLERKNNSITDEYEIYKQLYRFIFDEIIYINKREILDSISLKDVFGVIKYIEKKYDKPKHAKYKDILNKIKSNFIDRDLLFEIIHDINNIKSDLNMRSESEKILWDDSEFIRLQKERDNIYSNINESKEELKDYLEKLDL